MGALLAVVLIFALFVAFGVFMTKMHKRSQDQYDFNNMAGTLRREPWRPQGGTQRRTQRRFQRARPPAAEDEF